LARGSIKVSMNSKQAAMYKTVAFTTGPVIYMTVAFTTGPVIYMTVAFITGPLIEAEVDTSSLGTPLDHGDACGAKLPGQARSVGPGPLHTDPLKMAIRLPASSPMLGSRPGSWETLDRRVGDPRGRAPLRGGSGRGCRHRR
jgi:hypothetical protein